MRIRTRITLWYSGMLFVGLMLIGAASYYEIFIEHKASGQAHLQVERTTALVEVGEILLFGGGPALVIALVGGSLLMRRVLAPLQELTSRLENIQAENLGERISLTRSSDELAALTEVFNAMTARLNQSFTRIREFTLHASHELKTPLSIMRAELETHLSADSLAPADRDRCAALLGEIERLTHIVDSLTLLAKADSGLLQLDKRPLDLEPILQDAYEDGVILGQARGISLDLVRSESTTIVGDVRRLRQLLLILMDNAVKYNQTGGKVRLELRKLPNSASILIANTGPAIPEHELPRLFEPFFRGEATKAVEGCGLGLSIANWIVQAHHGKIEISSGAAGTEVNLLLPLAAPSCGPRA